jgi:hypothetical protein
MLQPDGLKNDKKWPAMSQGAHLASYSAIERAEAKFTGRQLSWRYFS